MPCRPAVLRMLSTQARIAVPAWCDGAGDDALALLVARDLGAQFLDGTDGLVADDQPLAGRDQERS